MKLRDYQQASVDAIVQYFMHNKTGNPLCVLPTGAGKSHVIAAFVQLVMSYPNQRVMMLTHVKELIEQNHEKLLQHWPDAPTGIYSAGLKRKDIFDDIIFAGIQSVHKHANRLGKFDIVLIDECHLISPSKATMYQKFLADLTAINPFLKIVGLTATPFRTSTGDITTSGNSLFDAICYEKPMLELINEGYLSPLIGKRTATNIDLSNVKMRGREYINKQLQEATDKEEITHAAVQEIISFGESRKSWLVFCAGVAHAHHVQEEFENRGIKAAVVTGETKAVEREQIINDYKNGHIKALCNCDVLTTGFDAPQTDLIALLRGTQSPGLYVQMAGRGTRLAEGKANCLILDFAGNVMRHGPVDEVRPWTPQEREKGEAPTKVCGGLIDGKPCNTICSASAKTCPECGYLFPFEEKPAHDATAGNVAIMSTESMIEEVLVNNVRFIMWEKKNSDNPPTLCVTYSNGLKFYKEWIPIFHNGFARNRARAWWSKFVSADLPSTTDFEDWVDWPTRFETIFKLLGEHYTQPKSLVVNVKEKYPRIINYVLEIKNENDSESNQPSQTKVA